MKPLLREILLRMGLDVRRHSVRSSVDLRRASILRRDRVDLVLDVGANVGQYALALRRSGYTGRIVSFEPSAQAYSRLARAAADDGLWEVRRVALAAESGEATLHVTENLSSSSLLEMQALHRRAGGPVTHVVGDERVAVARLDDIGPELLDAAARLFLKIDVQGGEREVLDGGPITLSRAAGVELELSLAPLYRGQATLSELLLRLDLEGFLIVSVEPGFSDPRTGRLLQLDAIAIRNNSTWLD
jgi:FkbM family methyltransferase